MLRIINYFFLFLLLVLFPANIFGKEYITIEWDNVYDWDSVNKKGKPCVKEIKSEKGSFLQTIYLLNQLDSNKIILQNNSAIYSIDKVSNGNHQLCVFNEKSIIEGRCLKSYEIPTTTYQKIVTATIYNNSVYVLLLDTFIYVNEIKRLSLISNNNIWEKINLTSRKNIDKGCSVIQNNGNEDIWYIFGKESFAYSFKSNRWNKLNIASDTLTNENLNLISLNSAIPLGTHNILSIGATKDILVYHTVTGQWHILGKLPFKNSYHNRLFTFKDKYYLTGSDEIHSFEIKNNGFFGFLNYLILILYFILMISIGVYFSKRTKSSKEFFIGSGKTPWWAVGISIFATTLSAITFMAIPAKTFISNWLYFPMSFSILIVAPIVIKWYLPFFRTLNITSAYEYLEKRFNLATRIFSSSFFIIFMITRIAIVLYLPSVALSTVTGADIYFCIGIISAITLIYSTLGGVEAVIWGDVVQGFILIGGAILSVILIVSETGGINETLTIASNADKFKLLDFSFNMKEPTFWVIFFGGGIANSLITYTSDQTIVQRYFTTQSKEKASKSIWLNGLISLPVLVIFYFIGTALYSFYFKNPSLLPYTMQNAEGIFPYFIINQMPAGLAGLLTAAIFAATMSTLSSNINSASTAFTCDFVNRFNPNINDKAKLLTARISGIIVCLLGTIIALWLSGLSVKSFFDTFNTFIGLFTSGLGALFLIGIFFPSIKGNAALTAVILCNVFLFSIMDLNIINFMMFGLAGIVLTIFISFILSPFFKGNDKNLNGLCWKYRNKY
ncbi:MAG: sodium:solute symporter [Bacteroidales bacterium]|nr:sodium:solute symporter [Bacteroidales bacterium]